MKRIILTLTILLSSITNSAFAIDKEALLSEDAKIIVGSFSELVGKELTTDEGLKLYNGIFKLYIESAKEWNMKPVNFLSATDSPVSVDSNVQFVEYALSIPSRTVFFNLIYYKDKNVVYYTNKEILPRSTYAVIEADDALKNKADHISIYDSSNSSMYNKDGYIDYTNFQVEGENSTVIYTVGGFVELQSK